MRGHAPRCDFQVQFAAGNNSARSTEVVPYQGVKKNQLLFLSSYTSWPATTIFLTPSPLHSEQGYTEKSTMKRPVLSAKALWARDQALALMLKHGLCGWKFGFDHSRRRAGFCRALPGQPGVITLSVYFVDLNAEAEILDTILHEIAHALVGIGHGHDEVWQEKCLEIGARPERCYDGARVRMPHGRWVATCPGCGQVFRRHRRPRVLTGWSCRRCGKEKGLLDWRSCS